MQSFCRGLFLSLLCILFAVASVQAGALWLYEEATLDMGGGRSRPPGHSPRCLNRQR